jgi:hypothetical protein
MEPSSHTAKPDSEWNESYYFVFYDKRQNFGGMTRLGFKPNKNEAMAFFILFLPDGSAGAYQHMERIDDRTRKKRLQAGQIVHQPQLDGVWKYELVGNITITRKPEDLGKIAEHPELVSKMLPVSMDVSLTPINDVYEYSENMILEYEELGKKSGDEHWEQIGRVNGQIKLGETTFSIEDAMGQRDHTNGVRDMTSIGNWLYYVIWFSQDLCANPTAIVTEDGRVSAGGFIFKNGKNIPIKSIRVLDQEFREEVFPVSSKLELIDESNQTHLLESRAGPVVPVPFTDKEGNLSILAQSFGTFTLDGVADGYGSFETLRRIRDYKKTHSSPKRFWTL